MKKAIYLLAFIVLFLTACNIDKKRSNKNDLQSEETYKQKEGIQHHSSTELEKRSIESTTKKTATLEKIINSYLDLKNALVEDDAKKAAVAGKMMLSAFSSFEMLTLTEKQRKEYLEIAEDSKVHADHIMKSPIDHQREHFDVLSVNLDDLIALVGTEKHLYQIFCPMYNNGKGAIWISETEEIRNPYYGSKMLTCGKVQKEIK